MKTDMKDWWAHITATVFYVGHLKPAPGTWGSLVALPMAWAIYMIGGFWLFALAIPAAYIKGYYATKLFTAGKDDHDPSEVVIDEVVGQWIALLPVIYGAQMMEVTPFTLWPGWIAAFVLFRWFDITKPGFVGKADQRNDATGVMLDDVIAGVFAAIGVVSLASIYHQVLM
jgi:phosphatidylglycerophosphatase A